MVNMFITLFSRCAGRKSSHFRIKKLQKGICHLFNLVNVVKLVN